MKDEKLRSSPEGTATDAEIAWRLHQELNAISPMLRTRARKAATSSKASGAETAKDEQVPEDEDATLQQSTAAAESPKDASAEHPPPKKGKGMVPVNHFKREVRTRTEKAASAVPAKRKLPRIEDGDPAPSKKKDRKPPAVEESTAPIPSEPPLKHRSSKRRSENAAETGEQQFAGFEAVLPTVWLPKDSDRIWFGSYKGKDWRYLGEGAWEPKSGVPNRIFNGAHLEVREKEEKDERSRGAETKKTSKDTAQKEQQQQPAPLEDPEDEFIVVDEPAVARPDRSRYHQQQQQQGERFVGDKFNESSAAKKSKKVPHRDSNIDSVGDTLRVGQDDVADGQQQPSSQLQDDHEAPFLPIATKERKNAVGEQLTEGNDNTGGRAYGRRRRGRPPGSVHARSSAENKASYGMMNKLSREQEEEEGEEGLLPRRSRRSARRAPIYSNDEFAQHSDDVEMEIVEVENPRIDTNTRGPHHNYRSGGSGLAAAEAATAEAARLYQQRRRRKPLVSSPAPTYVSPLEIDPEEYQALAALAEMPSPMEDTYYEEQEEIDIVSSVPVTHPQERHRHQRTQHQEHHYGDNNGRSGGGRRSSYMPHEHTKLMQRQHRGFEDYHSGGGVSGITSIAMAEQMFGRLLGAISSRLDGTANTSTTTGVNSTTPITGYNELDMKFSSHTSTSFCHMPAIINVDAELLKAALPFSSSDDGSGSPDTGDEGGGSGRKLVVPLFC